MMKSRTTTTYEYDKDGNIVRETVVEEIFEENNNKLTYPFSPSNPYSPFYYTTTTAESINTTTTTNKTAEN